ncbi:hypothetical protein METBISCDRAFT_28077 [Metschnikowia bicuspidata]|uniref:Nucleoporin Nup159/Nup146 N-terminal domain-containing protein n=1 Tax=Metschnikowia bicuspidata TaxID=27322 RepID=A0A4P9ZBD7_9ASCO|nr:hypothetical protein METBISCDRAFT_28077 [Metschnikowia bicuspidata]
MHTVDLMSAPEIEEYTSESVGFRLLVPKGGLQFFEAPVDFSRSAANRPLQLLHVGYVRELYAASNTTTVAVGRLRDLDNPETAKEKLCVFSLANTSCVRFNCTNEYLYIVADGRIHRARVDDILNGDASPTVMESEIVTHFEPHFSDPSAYLYISSDKLISKASSGKREFNDIKSASYNSYTSEIGMVHGSCFQTESTSFTASEWGNLIAVSCLDKDSWYLVGLPLDTEEDQDPIHILFVSPKDGPLLWSVIPVLPPVGFVERAPTVYCTSIVDWIDNSTFSFLAYGLSTDVNVVERRAETRLLNPVNDTDRAELPMDDVSGEDTFPIGFAIDLSGKNITVEDVCTAIDEAKGVLPRLMCLNNEGRLFMWHLFDSEAVNKETASLQRPLEHIIRLSSELTSVDSSNAVFGNTGFGKPAFGATGFAKAGFPASSGTPLFESTGFGSAASKPFGASALGGSYFGQFAASGSSPFANGQPQSGKSENDDSACITTKSSPDDLLDMIGKYQINDGELPVTEPNDAKPNEVDPEDEYHDFEKSSENSASDGSLDDAVRDGDEKDDEDQQSESDHEPAKPELQRMPEAPSSPLPVSADLTNRGGAIGSTKPDLFPKLNTFQTETFQPDAPKDAPLMQKEPVSKVAPKPTLREVLSSTEFLRFGGFSGPYAPTADVPGRMIQLVQFAQAHFDVLVMNVELLAKVVAAYMENPDGEEQEWTLASIADLQRAISKLRAYVDQTSRQYQDLNDKVSKLLKNYEEAETVTHRLQDLVAHIGQFEQSLKSDKIKERPMGIREEQLKLKIRQSLARVQGLRDDVLQKLIPFGIKMDLSENSAARIHKVETVIRQISAKTRLYTDQMLALENELAGCPQAQRLAITDSEPPSFERTSKKFFSLRVRLAAADKYTSVDGR